MKTVNTKLVTVQITQQDIWAASKHKVHASKKTYNRKKDKKKIFEWAE
jgi:hypothetical protein